MKGSVAFARSIATTTGGLRVFFHKAIGYTLTGDTIRSQPRLSQKRPSRTHCAPMRFPRLLTPAIPARAPARVRV
jgi:hypothetical protein